MAHLEDVVKSARLATVARRSASFAFGNADRGQLRTVHPREVDEVAVAIDNRDIHLPAMPGRFHLDRGDQLLRSLEADRRAVRDIEWRAVRRAAGGRLRCR